MSAGRSMSDLTGQEVAVIGMAGRFPGAGDVERFWQNLCEKVESIHFFADCELERAGVPQRLLSRSDYVKATGLLADVDRFDAAFFGMHPREAEVTDPQHRLFLECAWEALEAAGYDPRTYPGAIGVYAGAGSGSYALNVYSHREVLEAMPGEQVSLALDKDYLATRVSYKLGLRGPSLTVQTACSTSLVGVHLACQALLAGECHMALAGGVTISTSPQGYLYHEGGIHSPDGHCRAFDARARGTVGGSGLGIVVLKRLEDAQADGDQVYAVIKGSAINNDGDLKIGYTAPSIEGQTRVIRAALEVAEVAAETLSYVEAHGTGTPLGDPIEISALTQVFGPASGRRERCAIGSVKTNIGHLDAAAGIAGLIKTVLALDRRLLPPSLHFEQPNPQIDFAAGPFYVNTELTPWEANGTPRRAGVSSFGIGGTNAHLVLEEAPPAEPSGPARDRQLLVLSARTAPALESATDNLVEHLAGHPELPLADVAYTLQAGRSVFEHRRALVCRDREEAMALLASRAPQRVFTRHQKPLDRPLAFLFPGQGTQRPNLGRELYASEGVFAHWLDRSAELLAPHLGLDLRALLYPPDERLEEAGRRLAETGLAQPVLFAIEYALARLWMEWVGPPEVMLGHSIGEYVAACLAGVFSLEDALRLVAARGRLMQECAPGAMLAVELPPDIVEAFCGDELCLAAINGPGLSVLSGAEGPVAAVERQLEEQGVRCRRLRTSRAFHSSLMDPILAPFAAELRRVRLHAPQWPYVSNVTGGLVRAEEATDPEHWVRHLRRTVLFGPGLGALWQEPSRILLEVGPGGTLSSLALRHPARPEEGLALPSFGSRTGEAAALAAGPDLLLTALGRLWLAGVKVGWNGFHAGSRRRRVLLPTYPFERQRYWLELSPHGGLAGRDLASAAPADEPAAQERSDGEAQVPSRPAGYSRPELGTPYEAPRNAEERAVAECWQLLLGIELVGAHDDFFELGGDSLLATHMAARLRERFRLDLPLRDLLATPTVAGAAATIGALRHRQSEPQEPAALLPELVPDPERWHEPFPLTDVQQAYWVGRSGLLELGNVATHVYEEIDCVGLDLPRFNHALCRVIERQPMLRAVVLPEGRQQVLPEVPPYRVEVLDLAGRPAAEVEEELATLRRRMSHQVLPSDRWPLFEVRVARLDERRTRLHWSFDLLLGDAWSFVLLFSELARFYANPAVELAPLAVSQRDYVLAELELRQGELYQRSLAYWQARLPTLPPAPELPLARRLGEIGQPRFVRRTLGLDEPAWKNLKARAARAGVTPSGVLLAAFGEVLAVWSKTPRFTLNLTLFNRLPLHPQIEELVGDFTSLLLLEVDATGDDPFEARAQRLQGRLWEDLDHRYVSGVQVMRDLARVRGAAGQVAMPVVFTSVLGLRPPRAEGAAEPAVTLGADLAGEVVYSISQTPQVLFDFQVSEEGGALSCNWDVVEDAFPAGLVEDMLGATRRFLARLAGEEETWRQPVRRLMPAEQLELRQTVNATSRSWPPRTLDSLFVAQAASQPEHTAVWTSDRALSYGELDRLSAGLARRLQRLGSRPNRLVAVVLPKGWRQVVAVLAVVRSGAPYLPIDKTLPIERLRYLLQEGEVEIALCDRLTDAEIDWPPAVRRLWIEEADGDKETAGALAAAHRPDDLAYVIFTSGSTGQPKGVMIEHAAAVNTLLDVNQRFAVGPEDRVLALSSLSFDLSVYDVFGLLAAGGTVIVPEPEAARDPSRWLELMEQQRVSVWNSVPALLEMLLEHVGDRRGLLAPSLRLALLSGDWIPVGLPDRLKALVGEVRVVSLGGATEASIWSILYPIEGSDPARSSIPYGRPMANQAWHVLDHRLEPRPVWVPGELFIGGAGLARGYWRDDEKTRLGFLVDPGSGRRLYRTGDLGRYLPDGNIEFLGREDLQVKIQGHRIELGEIEAALEQHPEVRQAAVAAVGRERVDRSLVAYLVCDRDRAAAASEIEPFLRRKLPPYMIPASWVFLPALPLTANGKVDRKALPLPDLAGARQAGSVAPRTPVEAILAEIWCEILGLDRVGVEDSFFDLGGHSVSATQLISRLRKVFRVEVPLRSLFDAPKLSDLATSVSGSLRAGTRAEGPPLVPLARDQDLPLSYAQQRLWFLDQLQPGSAFYNMPSAFRLGGRLRVPALCLALSEVVRRHEVLRTVFPSRGGQPAQLVLPFEQLEIPAIDLAALSAEARGAEARRLAAEEAQRSFDLARGPLLRSALLRLGEEEHVVLFTLHHIVTDGWSNGLLVREVATLYRAFASGKPSPLPELPCQYVDFAEWQRRLLQDEASAELVSYWRRQLADLPPVLELATDRPRLAVADLRGGAHHVAMSARLTAELRKQSRHQSVTLFMMLLATFHVLLSRQSGQEDLCVGTPIAGRNWLEVEDLIGFFVNPLALRVRLDRDPSFLDLLERVREVTLEAYMHQDLPFEKLVEALAPERSLSHSPLFQVLFALQNAPAERLELPGLVLEPLPGESRISLFDLGLSLVDGTDVDGALQYRRDLFDPATVARIVERFAILATEIAADPSRRLSELPWLAAPELHQLLHEWGEGRDAGRGAPGVGAWFEGQAEQSPERVAVACAGEELTYGELNRRANQLAYRLLRLGVRSGAPVALCLERSPDLVMALFAIWKAGGAYVPLDPVYPRERLSYVLGDSGASVLVSERRLAERVFPGEAQRLWLDEERRTLAGEEATNPAREVAREDLAYILYTSGSTGSPKGVLVEHGNLVHVLRASREAFGWGAEENMPCVAPFSFDIFLFELLTPLLTGGTSALLPLGAGLDMEALLSALRQASRFHAVPALMRQVVDAARQRGTEVGRGLKTVFVGGDVVPQDLLRDLQEAFPAAEIRVLYGPTEGTIVCSSLKVSAGGSGQKSPIGRPLPESIVRLCDERGSPVPIGVAGELWIGGAGVTRGYLHQEELGREKYPLLGGARFYRTGDLARWLPEGSLEFLGRADGQVKIRGFRVELGELEASLLKHPGVREAVAVVRGAEPDGRRCVAYVVPSQPDAVTAGELLRHLQQKLPEHMVPQDVVFLDRLPLTPNGKVDRSRLPEPGPSRPELETAFVAPRTALEEELAAIWQDVLQRDRVGVRDNFFELGGHSLLAVRVISRVKEAFQLGELPLRSLFENSTVERLALEITRLQLEQQDEAEMERLLQAVLGGGE